MSCGDFLSPCLVFGCLVNNTRSVCCDPTRWWNRWVLRHFRFQDFQGCTCTRSCRRFPTISVGVCMGLVINPNLSQDFFIWLSESQRRLFCREPNAQGILGRTKVVAKLGSPKPQFCCFGTNIFWLNHTFCCLSLNLLNYIQYPFFVKNTFSLDKIWFSLQLSTIVSLPNPIFSMVKPSISMVKPSNLFLLLKHDPSSSHAQADYGPLVTAGDFHSVVGDREKAVGTWLGRSGRDGRDFWSLDEWGLTHEIMMIMMVFRHEIHEIRKFDHETWWFFIVWQAAGFIGCFESTDPVSWMERLRSLVYSDWVVVLDMFGHVWNMCCIYSWVRI